MLHQDEDDRAAGLEALDDAGAAWIEPPRLPIPDLAATCRHYLEIAEVLLEPPALVVTRAAVAEFLAGAGPYLQARLALWDAQSDSSFIHDFWRDLYLRSRAPLAIEQNVAGGIALPPAWRRAPLAGRAAAVALAVTDFLTAIGTGRLAQDIENGKPLCMRQYRALGGAVRIPGLEIDQVRTSPSAGHCIVAWRGGFFPLTLHRHGQPEPAPLLAGRIDAILRSPGGAPPVGVLTAAPRPRWAELRARIAPANHATLTAIESAAFILAIDDVAETDERTRIGRWLGGEANRWFEKAFQIILSRGPAIGCNIEHSTIDGFTAARLAQHVSGYLGRHPMIVADRADAGTAHPLPWRLDAETAAAIEATQRDVAHANQRLGLRAFDVAGGARGLKGDLAAQLALQLAYVSLTGGIESVYQPVHTRQFRAGRTEAVRPVTRTTVELCRRAARRDDDHREDEAAIAPLLRQALREIAARASRSRSGRGIDRHLLALYNLAGREGMAVPLFSDPAYIRLLGPAIICTSSMSGDSGLDAFAFGPVRPDGFGIAYIVQRERTRFWVTGWRDDLDAFCQEIDRALRKVSRLSHLADMAPRAAERV